MSVLTRSLRTDYQTNGRMEQQQQIDPKAVGSHLAHRPLSRRRSNPPGSPPDSDDGGSLFGADSLTSLATSLQHTLLLHQLGNNNNNRSHRKLDRSQSEPVQQQLQPQLQPGSSNSSRYKTELCRPYEENGTCKYGDKCQFAHGFHELRSLIRHPKYKTELCRTFHTIGFCPYGPRCHFVHNADEARNSSPPPPMSSSSSSSTTSSSSSLGQKINRGKFTLPGNGSTADSPSPPSSLSESPTSMSSCFFSDDLFAGFSPSAAAVVHQNNNNNNAAASAFLFGSADFVSPLVRFNGLGSNAGGNNKRHHTAGGNNKFPELDSPSPVGSLSSDLDSLSLGSGGGNNSPPPPPTISSPMDTSRALRLPIFSRISENPNED